MTGNFLLDTLAKDDLDRIGADLNPVTLRPGDVLYDPGDDVTHVWFPLSGMLSVVSVLIDGTHVESSSVGRESGVGFIEACGGGVIHSMIITQMEARALRIPVNRYREAFDSSVSLRRAVSQHVELLLTEARQEIACHATHSALPRLARWLLVCRDKAGSDHLEMTQEFLATMVATQRTTISAIASHMKAEGLIRYSRGKIDIRDAAGIERLSCECYATMKQFREAMGQPGSGPSARKGGSCATSAVH